MVDITEFFVLILFLLGFLVCGLLCILALNILNISINDTFISTFLLNLHNTL